MKQKILIVDDEESIATMIRTYLTLEGYEAMVCTRPTEAIDIIIKENIGIVISDIMMPDMNGLELLREIKKTSGLIQVVLITGYVTLENILTGFRLGANNMFFKPLENLDVLKVEVEQAKAKLERIRAVLRERALVGEEVEMPQEMKKARG